MPWVREAHMGFRLRTLGHLARTVAGPHNHLVDPRLRAAVDASVRYVWSQDPPSTGTFSADWAQFTIGVLVRVGK